MNITLQQDDCATDSLEYFNKQFMSIMNISFTDWCKSAKRTIHHDEIQYESDTHVVSCNADDPYWKLYTK